MSTVRAIPFAPARRRAARGFGQAVAALMRVISTRQGLVELDERMLKDLGISRAQARYEMSRPIWQLWR